MCGKVSDLIDTQAELIVEVLSGKLAHYDQQRSQISEKTAP